MVSIRTGNPLIMKLENKQLFYIFFSGWIKHQIVACLIDLFFLTFWESFHFTLDWLFPQFDLYFLTIQSILGIQIVIEYPVVHFICFIHDLCTYTYKKSHNHMTQYGYEFIIYFWGHIIFQMHALISHEHKSIIPIVRW